jgi:hypothetical protein
MFQTAERLDLLDWINLGGTLATVVGLILTLKVLRDARRLQSHYIFLGRVPELLKTVAAHASRISALLGDLPTSGDEIANELTQCQANLKSLRDKLPVSQQASVDEVSVLIGATLERTPWSGKGCGSSILASPHSAWRSVTSWLIEAGRPDMPIVDPKVNEVVLKLNKLTQDGRLDWRRIEPLTALGGVQERFKTTYTDKSFVLIGPEPLIVAFVKPGGSGNTRLEIVDTGERTLYSFPKMPSIDDLFAAVKQRVEKRKVDSLLDEFLNLPM